MEIIQDIDKLQPCATNSDLNSNQEVAAKLFKMLVKNPTGNKPSRSQVVQSEYTKKMRATASKYSRRSYR